MFRSYLGSQIAEVSWLSLYGFPVVSRRHTFNTDFLVVCLLKSFHTVFHNESQVLGVGLFFGCMC